MSRQHQLDLLSRRRAARIEDLYRAAREIRSPVDLNPVEATFALAKAPDALAEQKLRDIVRYDRDNTKIAGALIALGIRGSDEAQRLLRTYAKGVMAGREHFQNAGIVGLATTGSPEALATVEWVIKYSTSQSARVAALRSLPYFVDRSGHLPANVRQLLDATPATSKRRPKSPEGRAVADARALCVELATFAGPAERRKRIEGDALGQLTAVTPSTPAPRYVRWH